MNEIIVPGEKLGTEEEFAAGENTYVKSGILYSTVTGVKALKEGVLSVRSVGREVRTVGKGMRVLGSVVGDMKSVIFVKIDNINMGNKEYVAMKDGKIVMPKSHDRGHFQRHGPYEDRHEHAREPKPMRPCGIGDIIIASVQYNDKDSYALALEGNEDGVVYARCEQCNGEMEFESGRNMLRCKACGHTEARKISALYNKPEAIKKLFE